jgi:hypothetical protein
MTETYTPHARLPRPEVRPMETYLEGTKGRTPRLDISLSYSLNLKNTDI